jgi:hypothetical protein
MHEDFNWGATIRADCTISISKNPRNLSIRLVSVPRHFLQLLNQMRPCPTEIV